MKTKLLTAISFGAILSALSNSGVADVTGAGVVYYDTSVAWAPGLVKEVFYLEPSAWSNDTEKKELQLALDESTVALIKKGSFSLADVASVCMKNCKKNAPSVSGGATNKMSCDDVCTNITNRFIDNAERNSSFGFAETGNAISTIDGKYYASYRPGKGLKFTDHYAGFQREANEKANNSCGSWPMSTDDMQLYKVFKQDGTYVGSMVAYNEYGLDKTYLCMQEGYKSLNFKIDRFTYVDAKHTRHNNEGRLLYSNTYEGDLHDLNSKLVPIVNDKISKLRNLISQTEQYNNVFAGLEMRSNTGNNAIAAANDWLVRADEVLRTQYVDGIVKSADDFSAIDGRLEHAIAMQQGVVCAYDKLQKMDDLRAKQRATSDAEAMQLAQRWIKDAVQECETTITLHPFNCNGPMCSTPGASARVSCTVGDIAITYNFDGLCN